MLEKLKNRKFGNLILLLLLLVITILLMNNILKEDGKEKTENKIARKYFGKRSLFHSSRRKIRRNVIKDRRCRRYFNSPYI